VVLNHVAAIIFFAGPLFYIGLWMAVDPVGIANIPRWLFGIFTKCNENTAAPKYSEVPWPVQRALRVAGVTLVLIAIVV
jgi:hypothetical protein